MNNREVNYVARLIFSFNSSFDTLFTMRIGPLWNTLNRNEFKLTTVTVLEGQNYNLFYSDLYSQQGLSVFYSIDRFGGVSL